MPPVAEPRPRCREFRLRAASRQYRERLPRRARARPRQARAASEFDHLNFDFRVVENAEPELRRVLDVARLAEESIEIGVAIIADVLAGMVEERDRALGFPLGFDELEELVIHGYRVGADHDLLGIETEARVVAER